MQKHTKTYLQGMGYDETDYVPCEITGCHRKAVDVHHLKARGMGGNDKEYTVSELMGLCREHHHLYGDQKKYMSYLIDIHNNRMKERGIKQMA